MSFDIYSNHGAFCSIPECPCFHADSLYSSPCLTNQAPKSHGTQPATQASTDLSRAELGYSGQKNSLTNDPGSYSRLYDEPRAIKFRAQAQDFHCSSSFAPSNGLQGQEASALRGGAPKENIQTPATEDGTPSQIRDGALPTILRRPLLKGSTWQLAGMPSRSQQDNGLPQSLSASDQPSLARFTPPASQSPSPTKNTAVLHQLTIYCCSNGSAFLPRGVETHVRSSLEESGPPSHVPGVRVNKIEGQKAREHKHEDPEDREGMQLQPLDITDNAAPERDKGKGQAADLLSNNSAQSAALPQSTEYPVSPSRSFTAQEDHIAQGPPPSPRPGFKSFHCEISLPPLFTPNASVNRREVSQFIEGRDGGEAEERHPPPTPRLTTSSIAAIEKSPLAQHKVDALLAFNRLTPEPSQASEPVDSIDSPDSDPTIGLPDSENRVIDRSKLLRETIRYQFQLPPDIYNRSRSHLPPHFKAQKIREDNEYVDEYISRHRRVQTSTYEEEENAAPYLWDASHGMINLVKRNDKMDEHFARWQGNRNHDEELDVRIKSYVRRHGPPKSFMAHEKRRYEEAVKGRVAWIRKQEKREVWGRARKAGLEVDEEGFVVPPCPARSREGRLDEEAWEIRERRQREMRQILTGEDIERLPNVLSSIQQHEVDFADRDEHPELDAMRAARGIPPRQYPARHLPVRQVISARLPGRGRQDPTPDATFCPDWDQKHWVNFVQRHKDAPVPKIVITLTNDVDSEDEYEEDNEDHGDDEDEEWEDGEWDDEYQADWEGGDEE